MIRTAALALAALVAAFAFPAQALRITGDFGGRVDVYEAKYQAIAARGEHVRIGGGCHSACTLLLGLVHRDHICAEPGSHFGFHSASFGPGGPYSAQGTREMWATYPVDVRIAIRRRGWDGVSPHPGIIPVPATELVRACP